MVKPIVDNPIFFERHQEVNFQNTATLLHRAKQLYICHKEATAFLKLVIEIEQSFRPNSLVWAILLDDERVPGGLQEARKKVLNNLL